jgi:hypothetical protein
MGEWLLADGGVTSSFPFTPRATRRGTRHRRMVDRELPPDVSIETARTSFTGRVNHGKALEETELKNADVVSAPAWQSALDGLSPRFRPGADGEEAARKSLESIHESLPLGRRFARFTRRLLAQAKKNPPGA